MGIDTLDLPELLPRSLFPLLLVVVLAHMGMRSVDGPSSHSGNIASTRQQVLALASVQAVDTVADRGCRQVARVVKVLAVVSVR